MKRSTFKSILILSLSLIAFVGCSKDDDHIYIAPKTVNDINLTFNEIEIPITPEDPGNHSVWFSMVGDKMYYVNASNTPFSQFMLEYDITNNNFSNKTPSTEVCGCGYSSQLITDGNDIYYIANEAVKYSPVTDTWTELNYPAEFKSNNGETGVAYLNGKIYFFGGRTATNTFKYFETATDSWHMAPDGPYLNETSEVIAVNSTLYSLGGTENVDRQKFSSYNETTGWNELPNLPFNLKGSKHQHLVASYDNRFIFVLEGNDIHVFDTIEQEWKTDSISFPTIDLGYESMFIQGNTMYISGISSTNEFTLIKIDIQL